MGSLVIAVVHDLLNLARPKHEPTHQRTRSEADNPISGPRHPANDGLAGRERNHAIVRTRSHAGIVSENVAMDAGHVRMDDIYDALCEADLFVSIGTSGAVYPAAGFVQQARKLGARTLELNLEASHDSRWFDETRLGSASKVVTAWVEEMLAYLLLASPADTLRGALRGWLRRGGSTLMERHRAAKGKSYQH